MPNFASIATYRSEVDKIIRYGASTSETAVRRAFSSLINAYTHPRDLLLVEELDYFNRRRRKTVRPDGTLKNALRLDYGFWESKDTNDNLHDEIARKFDRGYPDSNTSWATAPRSNGYSTNGRSTRSVIRRWPRNLILTASPRTRSGSLSFWLESARSVWTRCASYGRCLRDGNFEQHAQCVLCFE